MPSDGLNITGDTAPVVAVIGDYCAEIKAAINSLAGKTVNVNITAERCAELLGVSLEDVYRLRASGELNQRVRDALSGRRDDVA